VLGLVPPPLLLNEIPALLCPAELLKLPEVPFLPLLSRNDICDD
jgi:hypothetical protein